MFSIGKPAPTLSLATATGARYSLSAEKGHPVLREFFAIWCPHCQRESAVLNQIESDFSAKGLKSLAILANPYGQRYDSSGGSDRTLAVSLDLVWFIHTFNR